MDQGHGFHLAASADALVAGNLCNLVAGAQGIGNKLDLNLEVARMVFIILNQLLAECLVTIEDVCERNAE